MAWWAWRPLTAAVVRQLPVTVLDVSAGGCFIQAAEPLVPGAIGLLQLDHSAATDPVAEADAIRVCHSLERAGSSSPFYAGAEFLVFDAAAVGSMRATACRMGTTPNPSRLVMGEENSGAELTGPKVAASAKAELAGATPCDDGDM